MLASDFRPVSYPSPYQPIYNMKALQYIMPGSLKENMASTADSTDRWGTISDSVGQTSFKQPEAKLEMSVHDPSEKLLQVITFKLQAVFCGLDETCLLLSFVVGVVVAARAERKRDLLVVVNSEHCSVAPVRGSFLVGFSAVLPSISRQGQVG